MFNIVHDIGSQKGIGYDIGYDIMLIQYDIGIDIGYDIKYVPEDSCSENGGPEY